MTIMNIFYLTIALLAGSCILSFFKSKKLKKEKIFKYIFWISIILLLIFFIILSINQYKVWLKDGFTKFFLPPYHSVNYFLFYVFTRFFIPYLISFFAALIFIFLLNYFNKKYGERFFYPEEIYFGATAVFLLGYPNFLFYIVLMLILGVILTSLSKIRFSLYYFWLPSAIFVIIISKWLTALPMWQILKI